MVPLKKGGVKKEKTRKRDKSLCSESFALFPFFFLFPVKQNPGCISLFAWWQFVVLFTLPAGGGFQIASATWQSWHATCYLSLYEGLLLYIYWHFYILFIRHRFFIFVILLQILRRKPPFIVVPPLRCVTPERITSGCEYFKTGTHTEQLQIGQGNFPLKRWRASLSHFATGESFRQMFQYLALTLLRQILSFLWLFARNCVLPLKTQGQTLFLIICRRAGIQTNGKDLLLGLCVEGSVFGQAHCKNKWIITVSRRDKPQYLVNWQEG